ncbi:MAG TPA: maleylpyruvate isomerase family mycothiol-dependent enzyme [Mycobacteriales bacterium]|nr:maleylpyruvate isomerase family mycothiol-dependent enzyme [Mycobacteriales bacterium]
MPLSRDQVSQGFLEELDRFAAFIGGLADEQFEQPTRCEGWTVRDVAAHVVGTNADIAAGRLEGLGTPEVTQREVDERKDMTPKQMADECAQVRAAAAGLLPAFDEAAWDGPAPGGYDGSLGEAVEALWSDVYVHADDIRAALGMPTETGPGLVGAVAHVELFLGRLGWAGDVPSDEAGAHEFVLAATGRADDSGSIPNIYA